MNALFRMGQVLFVAAALVVLALSVFAYKYTQLGFPLSPDHEKRNWLVETRLTFTGTGGPATVTSAVPHDTPRFTVLKEARLPDTFGDVIEGPTRDNPARFAVMTRRELAGRSVVFHRSKLVEKDTSSRRRTQSPPPEAVSEFRKNAREQALATDPTPFLISLNDIVTEAYEESVERPGFAFALQRLLANTDDIRVQTLIEGAPVDLREPARRLVFSLNAGGYPARRVTGLMLSTQERQAEPIQWVDFWRRDTNTWQAIDPVSGEVIEDERLLPLAYDEDPLFSGAGVRNLEHRISVQHFDDTGAYSALWGEDRGMARIVSALSLFNLPIDEQMVFRVLLLVPLGAAVIAFLRQVVGLQTFGTFMPVLIALSFRESGLVTGVALFVLIVAIGLMLRAYFNQLKLLVVPRLASVMIMVTFVMMGLSLISSAAGFQTGLSLSLFPLVILTMTIERMSLNWDEFGARSALIKGAGSLGAAVLAYLLISNDRIEHLVFTFPELLLIALAFTILLGRYNGYKLTEYMRFRMFGRDEGLGL